MEKKKLTILILIIIFIIVLLIKFIPFGQKEYKILNMKINVPKLSKYDNICCMYSAAFKSFRSKYILEKEFDNIMKKYKKLKCNEHTYYYDEKDDITIIKYSVERGVLFNKFYIIFDKGYYCNETK